MPFGLLSTTVTTSIQQELSQNETESRLSRIGTVKLGTTAGGWVGGCVCLFVSYLFQVRNSLATVIDPVNKLRGGRTAVVVEGLRHKLVYRELHLVFF